MRRGSVISNVYIRLSRKSPCGSSLRFKKTSAQPSMGVYRGCVSEVGGGGGGGGGFGEVLCGNQHFHRLQQPHLRRSSYRPSSSSNLNLIFDQFITLNSKPSMTLKTIIWNNLYRSQPLKRAFAERRILLHYERRRLGFLGVSIANVRYVLYMFFLLCETLNNLC